MRKIAMVLVAMVVVLPRLAFSQPSQNPKDAKFQDRMATMRAYKLVEYLDLTTEEAVKLAPAMKEQKNIQKAYREKKEKMLNTLAELLEKGSDSADLKKAMAELQKLDADFSAATQEQTKKMLALLPVEKQAKYYLFERYFASQIRQSINQKGKRQQQTGEQNQQSQPENMQPE